MDKGFNWLICLVALIFFLVIIDSSKLTHHTEIGDLLDKWHEESCVPMYDSNMRYMGEDCSDEYTLALKFGDRRVEEKVFGSDFRKLRVGDRIKYQFDLGRLGMVHSQKFETLSGKEQF